MTYVLDAEHIRSSPLALSASMQRMLAMSVDINEILALTVSERIRLVEEITFRWLSAEP